MDVGSIMFFRLAGRKQGCTPSVLKWMYCETYYHIPSYSQVLQHEKFCGQKAQKIVSQQTMQDCSHLLYLYLYYYFIFQAKIYVRNCFNLGSIKRYSLKMTWKKAHGASQARTCRLGLTCLVLYPYVKRPTHNLIDLAKDYIMRLIRVKLPH